MWCDSAHCVSIPAFRIGWRMLGCGTERQGSGSEMNNPPSRAAPERCAPGNRAMVGRAALVLLTLLTGAAAAADTVTISQRNRKFSPDQVSVARGSVLHVVNDDRVTHHVQVDGPGMAFDSGEQPI